MKGRALFCWKKAAWLHGMIAVALVFGRAPTAGVVLVSLLLGFVTLCVGHSVGLHRGVIHGAYRASPMLRRLLAYLFVHTGLGGPLSWMRLHQVRDRWQNRADAPAYFRYDHGPLRDFVWNLHMVWRAAEAHDEAELAPAFADPWLRFLERTWALHVLALFAVVAVVWGVAAAATVVCARVAAGILGHWLVGYVAHTHGYVRWSIDGAPVEGKNTWLLGVLSFGEGFHNNHHAHPGSARMGQAWWELDLGWAVIRLLERAGLVSEVHSFDRGGTLKTGAHAA